MKYIDDPTWLNIVNFVQGDEIKGANLLNIYAFKLEELRKDIRLLEKKLNSVKSIEKKLLIASQDVAKHLKKQLPLAVKKKDYILVLSDINLSI